MDGKWGKSRSGWARSSIRSRFDERAGGGYVILEFGIPGHKAGMVWAGVPCDDDDDDDDDACPPLPFASRICPQASKSHVNSRKFNQPLCPLLLLARFLSSRNE